MNSKSIGSSVESFFEEVGLLEQVKELAVKEILAEQVAAAMKARHMNLSQLSRRMKTTRTSVRRLLEPKQKGLTLETLTKAANALGCRVSIQFGPPSGPAPKTKPAMPARSTAQARR
jgi:antitoxin HicB